MRIPSPRDGCPFPQERVSPTRGRPPLWRGRAFHFPRDGGQFSDRRAPITEERAPRFPGTGSQFPRDCGTQCGACGTPYATDGHPLSVPWWTHTLPFRMAGPPIPKGWGPGFRCMVTLCSEDCYTFVRWTGPPFPRDWEPLFSGMSAGKSFSTPDNDAPLENPRSATCRRRSQAHGLDPLASICETTRVLLPHTGVP